MSSAKASELQREVRDLTQKIERKRNEVLKEERDLARVKEEIESSQTEEKKLEDQIKQLQSTFAEKVRTRQKREADQKINMRQHTKEQTDLSALERELQTVKKQVTELQEEMKQADVRPSHR